MSFPLTNLTPNHLETYKSDKTVVVSNNEFLRAIFSDSTNEECPMLVSFAGNPNEVIASKWYGKPWDGDSSTMSFSPNVNNYFSLGRYRRNDKGEYRRQKAQFVGLYAVMLDDIGSKVAIERLTLPPSWLIETSPGNHQAGYLLNDPLASSKEADDLY